MTLEISQELGLLKIHPDVEILVYAKVIAD